MTDIKLVPLNPDDREQFITDNQEAFNYGALEEFGRRDDHFEEDGEIISRETIEKAIDGGEAYRIMQGDKKVSNTYRYSIESYAASMRTDEGTTPLDKLLDAMMHYGDSAAAYAGNN